MVLFGSMMGGGDFYPYKINESCRFNDDDNAYLNWTPGGDGGVDTWTLSFWVKRCELTSANWMFGAKASADQTTVQIGFDATDHLDFVLTTGAGAIQGRLTTTQVFRDTTNWYHIVAVLDTTNATGGDRMRLYVNGSEVTSFSTDTNLTQNINNVWMADEVHIVGGAYSTTGALSYFDGYLAEIHCIDDAVLDADSFGQSKNGVWIPKRYIGTYGTNGFYLDFADSGDLGDDESGNNNDFTASGLTSADQVEDSPTNNYPVINILENNTAHTYSNGNLTFSSTSATLTSAVANWALPKSGKWYWENTLDSVADDELLGISGHANTGNRELGTGNLDYCYKYNGQKKNDGTLSAYGDTYGINDIIGIYYDADNGTIGFTKNGVDQGEAFSGIDNDNYNYFPAWGKDSAVYDGWTTNFGQLGFSYTPPTGYKALNSKNLPNLTAVGKKPYNYFDVKAYSGDGSASRDIITLSFPPDLVWVKNRNGTNWHNIADRVRGGNHTIYANDFVSEDDTGSVNGWIDGFLTNGFTVVEGSTSPNEVNGSGYNYISYCWKELAACGMDIVLYTGTGTAQSINHNLGAQPELIIVKNRSSNASWPVFHHHALNRTDPETDNGYLDVTNSWADQDVIWNDTAPNSTQFTVGTSSQVNTLDDLYVAYLFRSVEGFSKVFSYTGNGNAEGPYVWLGFRPKFYINKNASDAYSWIMYDTIRDPYNPMDTYLLAEAPDIEVNSSFYVDFLSSGFKVRNTNFSFNISGNLYVGIALAEMPFKFSNAR